MPALNHMCFIQKRLHYTEGLRQNKQPRFLCCPQEKASPKKATCWLGSLSLDDFPLQPRALGSTGFESQEPEGNESLLKLSEGRRDERRSLLQYQMLKCKSTIFRRLKLCRACSGNNLKALKSGERTSVLVDRRNQNSTCKRKGAGFRRSSERLQGMVPRFAG